MEFLLRTLFFLVVGGILLLANIWFVQTALQAFFHRGIVIAPFDVVGGGAPDTGRTLANLLQARLRQLQTDLQRTQSRLISTPNQSAAHRGVLEPQPHEGKPPPPIPAFWAEPINLNTALFEPVNINITVGGVEVGRLVPWIQRALLRSQMLGFTVSYEDDKTIIAGDIRPLDATAGSIWIETDAKTPNKIADLIAHELILRQLASDGQNPLGALDREEFQILTTTLFETARLNERISRGRSARKEFSGLLPGVEKLVEKVPDWSELLLLAAAISENAGSRDKALQLYTKLNRVLSQPSKVSQIANENRRAAVALKISELRTSLPEGFFTGLGRKIITLTGLFEFGSDSPEKLFGTVYALGEEDVSFGVASWGFHNGTLAPLLREFQSTDAERFRELLGDGAKEIDAVIAGDREVGLAFARRIQDDKHQILESWRMRFQSLGREPKFQDVQVRTLEPFFRKAVALAEEYRLRSERGLALCFNVIFVQGGIRAKTKDAVVASFAAFEREHRQPPGEVERMRIIANALSESINPRFREVIRARYLVIANGSGSAAGKSIDLNNYGLRLADFRTGEPIKEATAG